MKKLLLLSLLLISGLVLTIEPVISQVSREWTIVASYTIPGKASGLAWDGTYLYSGLYGTSGPDDLIYQIDPSDGSYTLLCTAPQETTYGLCFDGNNFWSTDRTGSYTPAIAVEFNYSGTLVSSFTLPATYMSGIEHDAGNFWVCCYYNPDGMVYKLDATGNILTQFPSPEHQPWDICKENDYLWIADYNANMLYKTETDGTLVESHPSNGIKPAGITFDGQYLWYVDGQLSSPSTLYKVDLGGSGTPVIYIPENYHDYGIVTVGESSTWNMLVQNTGTGDLTINSVQIPSGVPVSTTFATPYTITAGGSVLVPLTYAPTEAGTLNAMVNIVTNDPVHPVTPVTLAGQAVAQGPMLQADYTSHNYGQKRITASSRWFLHIWNTGNAVLEINDIVINDEAFYLDENVQLPILLGPLDTTAIGLWFSPYEGTSYNDIIQIINNDQNHNPFEVTLSGSGLDMPWPVGSTLWHYFIDVSYDNSPKAITWISDITGDGTADVIIGSEDNYIRCFNGNSHGLADVIWERHIYSGSVYNQHSIITVEDINGDGYDDVIAGTAWGDRSIIALSGKTGAIIWKHDTHEYGDGGWVYQVDASFDYNSDGHPDILAATGDDANDTGPRRIYCLNALTGQSIWECYTGGPNFSVIGIEDVNGDGIPDVLAGASNNAETIGKVYAINGANGAILWTVNMPGSSVWALGQLNDLNNDGIKDVIAGDFSGNIRLLSGTNGAILGSSGIGYSLILRFVKIDDINGDGHEDILVAHSGTNGIVISGLDASNLWLQPLADKSWCVAKSNDLDGDGLADVLIGTLFSSNYYYFLSGADGTVIHSMNFGTPVDAIAAIPDIVGDYSYEMIAGGRDGRVNCFSGGIDSPIAVPENMLPTQNFHSFAYPNPFSDQTRISFYLPADSRVTVEIYTAGGRLVSPLIHQNMPFGMQAVIWDGKNDAGHRCPAGVYVYRVLAGDAPSTGMLLLVN